jgi:hypothetical protein
VLLRSASRFQLQLTQAKKNGQRLRGSARPQLFLPDALYWGRWRHGAAADRLLSSAGWPLTGGRLAAVAALVVILAIPIGRAIPHRRGSRNFRSTRNPALWPTLCDVETSRKIFSAGVYLSA